MVEKWAAAVVTLSTVAERYPQTAYAGFTFCMQNEWQAVIQCFFWSYKHLRFSALIELVEYNLHFVLLHFVL
jgi:hypothetical protein